MIKNTLLVASLLVTGLVSAQWTPTKFSEKSKGKDVFATAQKKKYYKLDINEIRTQLKDAQLQGPNAKPVVVSIPMMNGKVEKFNVYSFPSVVPELAEQYELGAYTGVSVENPNRFIRFSVAPNDFQSTLFENGEYQFITPVDKSQGIYAVHYKTIPTGDKPFVCSTEEHNHAEHEIDNLRRNNSFANNPADFSRHSDRKYRTMRLVVSVTGEYTQAFGGTVAGALAQINATITRTNFVFEKDFGLHLVLQNFPNVIYTDAATDPYTAVSGQAPSAWNLELQRTLTSQVGEANYDIGHLFGASGGGGNAGCIGCVCISPTNSNPRGKGSAYTSPASGLAQGDAFDIDYVAHEIGHQLGANHTFSHALEGTGVNMEPGSGSTIMGYAGITNQNVQMSSDAYFHAASIQQVQNNLISKTCDIETDIANTPPTINPFPAYTIPKGTAFVLTGNATDAEGDPMTYTWEQYNTATAAITRTNLGNTTDGAAFRSKLPSTDVVRYFPAFNTVMNGTLRDTAGWEAVPSVARSMKFRFTARDNNANVAQQQTNFAEQDITVGNDGPFQITSTHMNAGVAHPLTWDVANTASAPYNSPSVKIDYTTDNGTTWTELAASTANDGSEDFTFPASLNGQTVKVRISSIGNIFYAVKTISVTTLSQCDGSAPSNVTTSNITSNSAFVSWTPVLNATYSIRYKETSATNWTTVSSNNPSITLTGLNDTRQYEVQVAAICGTTTGNYSTSVNFTTASISYCNAATANNRYEYISNVTLANVNNNSSNSVYTDYTNTPSLRIDLQKGNQYTISVTKAWVDNNPDNDAVSAWIDFDRDGVFSDSERILTAPSVNTTTPVTANFTVPATAVEGVATRMRVINLYVSQGAGYIITGACLNNQGIGEVEDYSVMITPQMSTIEANAKLEATIYPNPAVDVLNITKVSNKAEYTIVNAAGQVTQQGNINDNKVSVTSLEKGVYIITVKDGGKTFSEKFIKK